MSSDLERTPDSADSWICRHCWAEVDGYFEVCWQCGTSQEGKADPDFRPVSDATELPASPDEVAHCKACDYAGPMLVSYPGQRGLLLLWAAGLGAGAGAILGSFLSLVLFQTEGMLGLGLLGAALAVIFLRRITSISCPQCGSHEHLERWDSKPDPAAAQVLAEAQQATITTLPDVAQLMTFAGLVIGILLVLLGGGLGVAMLFELLKPRP